MQATPSRETYRFADFAFDPTSGELHKDGLKVRLQEQPYQILSLLLTRPGEVVTREEVRQALWPGDTFVDFDVGLNSAIKRLRDALDDSAEKPRFVETLPRRGYRFIAPLEARPVPAPAPTEDQALAKPGKGSRLWSGRRAAAVAAVAALLAGLTVTGTWPRRRAPDAPAPIRSLAVLPFENLTGDPQQDYFVDGMTDAVITEPRAGPRPAGDLAHLGDAIPAGKQGVAPDCRGAGCGCGGRGHGGALG